MKHYNPSITERANRIFNLKNGDGISDEVDGPVAVIPIQPTIKIVRRSVVAGGVIYTTPTDKDFYIVSVSLSVAKTAAQTGSNVAILTTIEGASISILDIRGITLTAQDASRDISFHYPIKLDRGTTITLSPTGDYTSLSGIIYGYTEEVTRN